MSTISFHWTHDSITPRLLQAVGAITLHRASIDAEIIQMLRRAWFDEMQGQVMPRSFDKRVGHLKNFAANLYKPEPEEFRFFAWFLQRLKTANGLRDDVCHGIPGMITKGRRTYEGLRVPHPAKDDQYKDFSIRDIEELVETLRQLRAETRDVSGAFSEARAASSPNRQTWQDRDGLWVRLSWDNRGQKLPRWNPPPPTFVA